MSDSYSLSYRTCPNFKVTKRLANRRVRNTLEISNGRYYKKLFPSYSINDGGRAKPIPKQDNDWTTKARRK